MIAKKNIQKDHGKTGKIHAENTRIRCKMLKENHLNNIKGRASHVTFVKKFSTALRNPSWKYNINANIDCILLRYSPGIFRS